MRQTLGRPESVAKEPDRSSAWGWRWGLGLASATAVVLLVGVNLRLSSSKLKTVQELGLKQEALSLKQEATPNEPAGHEPVLTASGRLLAPNGPGLLTEEAFKQAAAQNLPEIQLAIFDLGGHARRANKNQVTILEETWKGIQSKTFPM